MCCQIFRIEKFRLYEAFIFEIKLLILDSLYQQSKKLSLDSWLVYSLNQTPLEWIIDCIHQDFIKLLNKILILNN